MCILGSDALQCPRRLGHFEAMTRSQPFSRRRVFFNVTNKFRLSYVVPNGPINNIPTLVQIMAWRRPGDKPLSEPMKFRLPTHICVARLQRLKSRVYDSVISGDNRSISDVSTEHFPHEKKRKYYGNITHISHIFLNWGYINCEHSGHLHGGAYNWTAW